MNNFPSEKYKIYTNNKDIVVAVTTYRDTTIREEAICSSEDTFDFEIGKAITIARVEEDIALLKVKSAHDKQLAACTDSNTTVEYCRRLHQILMARLDEFEAAHKKVIELTK